MRRYSTTPLHAGYDSAYRVSVLNTSAINSDVSVADTIHQMMHVVRFAQGSPRVKDAVRDAIEGLSKLHTTDKEIASAVYYWIKQHVKFTEDEVINKQMLGMSDYDAMDTELLITPDVLLSMQQPMGDCDDFSTLCASMMMMLGFKAAFVTIAADASIPDVFSHVYVKVWLDDTNHGLYMDCSHGLYPGWEHGYYTRKKEWAIN